VPDSPGKPTQRIAVAPSDMNTTRTRERQELADTLILSTPVMNDLTDPHRVGFKRRLNRVKAT
jgi:hypothetical protein